MGVEARKERADPRPWLRAVNIVVIAAVAVFLAVECLVFSGAFQKPPEGLDAIIVLGARVNENGPSGSLRQRINAARVYLEENPDTVCIASGGQGEDEPMSEAECIRDHLVAGGIDADRILLEDRSTSTEENMRYSLPMLRSLETDVESVGIVTNDFHVFRALCLARKNGGFTFYGVPARSTVFGFIHYAMREFFTLSRIACPRIHLIKPQKRLSVHTAESPFFIGAAPSVRVQAAFSQARQSASISSTACETHAGRPSVKHSSPTLSSSSQYV